MELNLNELERRAESAGGQEWTLTIDATGDAFLSAENSEYVAEVGAVGEDGIVSDYGKFIAAANPAVVLELVRRLREAERWRDAVIDQLDVMHITCARHKDDPAFAVHDCMAYSVNLALDPAVSEQAQALLDAGREAARAELDKQEPVFWYRPRMDDGYEGPLHDSQIEQVRRESGAWVPLIAKPIQPARGADGE